MAWQLVKWAFYVCAGVWIVGGAITTFALMLSRGGSLHDTMVMNLRSLLVDVFGGLAIILGLILLGRMMFEWSRRRRQP